jgi:predicted nucleic acid-binding protein
MRERFQVVQVQGNMVDRAIVLLLQHGKRRALRTLDALQITAAQAVPEGPLTFMTADKPLAAVAKDIFAQVINPEEQPLLG